METGGLGYISSSLLIKRVVRVGFTPPCCSLGYHREEGEMITHMSLIYLSLINLSLNIVSEISCSMYFCPPDNASLNDVSLNDVSLPCKGGGSNNMSG